MIRFLLWRVGPWVALVLLIAHLTGFYTFDMLTADVFDLVMRPVNWLINAITDAVTGAIPGIGD